jgi:hypothetical protein
MSRALVPIALAMALALPVAPARATELSTRTSDWPCVQRLVPELSASSLWSGAPPPALGAWRSDASIGEVVDFVTPRGVPADVGEKRLAEFLAATDADQRAARAAAVFAGLLEATNAERADLIGRIKMLGHRQRELADLVAQVTDEVQAIPATASGEEADRRNEAIERRGYLIREFEETQRTMRFACEAPTQLEARLGRYARVLQGQN